ncbi:MAG: hypothetical protein K6E86_07920 [Bacteroidales bacterium]|nr:hypothetical protein [Bacteroidales bacterium]
MNDYIIHNICLTVEPSVDFYSNAKEDKPILKYPNYYIGETIGKAGSEINLFRTRQGGEREHIPNCVLRNENGIALIRVHNKEKHNIISLPQDNSDRTKDGESQLQYSYPSGNVIIDYRDGRCQIAIEKTSSWKSETSIIKNSLEDFFRSHNLLMELGIQTEIKVKSEKTKFEDFIDCRTINHGDTIESFTFQYVNINRSPTARIPRPISKMISDLSNYLDNYNAISGSTTMNVYEKTDNEKLKQLSTVVTMCSDNAFDLLVKFRDYGEYKCNEDIIAKYPMNDIVITNYKDYIKPERNTSDFDLITWLDDVFEKVKIGKNDRIPTKPS